MIMVLIIKMVIILVATTIIGGSEFTSSQRPVTFERTKQEDYNSISLKTAAETDTGQLAFENTHRDTDSVLDLMDNNSDIHDVKPKVKFNDYGDIDNFDYLDNPALNNNGKFVFEDNPKIPERKETVRGPIKFENDETNFEINGHIAFDDAINVDQNLGQKKKRKRRRRPKNYSYPNPTNLGMYDQGAGQSSVGHDTRFPEQVNYANIGYYPLYQGYPNEGYAGSDQNVGFGYQNSFAGYPTQPPGIGVQQSYLGPVSQYGFSQPGLQGLYRPSRRPKSLASKAVSALSEALTSIATNDDHQCVPRLLCEAAGGRASGSNLLQSVTGLEPLLSFISTYNALSTSPLFVFGRAVFLGMTSKGNAASCRYAYPQCPTNPEKLIHYLNNHKGGFFRFFNSPLPNQNQNVEQFYNQLAGQYGLYQANGYQPSLAQGQYGLLNQNPSENNKKYGFYKDNIQDRIQNKPDFDQYDATSTVVHNTVDANTKWQFPNDNSNNDIRHEIKPSRANKRVRFPGDNESYDIEHKDTFRKGKKVFFPEGNRPIQNITPVHLDDYVFDYKHNFYVKRPKLETQKVKEDDGLRTVYIVRGNGDPNHPEVVRIRPGYA